MDSPDDKGPERSGENHGGTSTLDINELQDEEELLKLLDEHKIDPCATDRNGVTLLHKACLCGWRKVVAQLLELPGVDLKAEYPDSGYTPLHIAVELGHAQIVQSLVRKGADINKPDKNGHTPLHTAVFHSHLKTVKYLLKKGAKPDITDNDGALPLHLAAWIGHVDILNTLITETKPDINVSDLDGCTPLSFAVDHGSLPAVLVLLEHGADLRTDLTGTSPIHKAVANNYPEVLQALLNHFVGKSSSEANKGSGSTKSAIVDATNLDGYTPLMLAAEAGFEQCVQILLQYGASLNLTDKRKRTALHKCAFEGHTRIADMLADAGADITARDEDGNTPTHKAAEGGKQSVLAVLARRSADPAILSVTNRQGTTPLMMACAGGFIECVRILLMFSDPESIAKTDKNGFNALHLSAAEGREEIVRTLLQHPNANFDIDQLTRDKSSAIVLALKGKHYETARVLAAFGASFELNAAVKRTLRHVPEAILKEIETISKNSSTEWVKQRKASVDRDIGKLSLRRRRTTDRKGSIINTDFSAPPQQSQSQISISPASSSKRASGASPKKRKPSRTDSHTGSVEVKTVKRQTAKERRNTAASLTPPVLPESAYSKSRTKSVAGSFAGASKSVGDMNLIVDDLLSDLIEDAPSPTNSVTESDSASEKEASSALPTPKNVDRNAIIKEAVSLFNTKPQKAIDLLIDNEIIEDNCTQVAKFLFENDIFNKTALGNWLSDRNEFNLAVLEAYVEQFDWAGLEFDVALRRFLQKFRLPGEAQKIDRIMEAFAARYYKQNPKTDKVTFADKDAVYILAFSTIMLNTDLHNPNIKPNRKMTKAQFVKNNTGINGGRDFPTEFIEELYDRIKENEIKMESEDSVFDDAELKGWLTKQGGRIKTWKRRWFILKENCLFYFKTDKDKEPAGIIPLENLRVSLNRKYKNSFELTNHASGPIKATSRKGDALVMASHDVYIFQADDEVTCRRWVDSINRNIYRNPIHQLLATKRQQRDVD